MTEANSGNSNNESLMESIYHTVRQKFTSDPEERQERRKLRLARVKADTEKASASGQISKTQGTVVSSVGDYVTTKLNSWREDYENKKKQEKARKNIRTLKVNVKFPHPGIRLKDKIISKLDFTVTSDVSVMPEDVMKGTSADDLIKIINGQFNDEMKIKAGGQITDYVLSFGNSKKSEIKHFLLSSKPYFGDKSINVYALRKDPQSSDQGGERGDQDDQRSDLQSKKSDASAETTNAANSDADSDADSSADSVVNSDSSRGSTENGGTGGGKFKKLTRKKRKKKTKKTKRKISRKKTKKKTKRKNSRKKTKKKTKRKTKKKNKSKRSRRSLR